MARSRRWLGKLGLVGRPVNPESYSLNRRPMVVERRYNLTLPELYDIAKRCNAIRKSVQTLRDYLFKEGFEWEKEFSKRCKVCGYLHEPDAQPDRCASCGGTDFDEPDPSKVVDAEKFFKRVNRNGDTLMETLKKFEDHLNVADDAFIIGARDYVQDSDGKIVSWKIRELLVPDSRNFMIVQDPTTQTYGGLWWVCLVHRPTNRPQYPGGPAVLTGTVYNNPGKCAECNRILYDVWYVSTEHGMSTMGNASIEGAREFYIGDVVLPDGKILQEVVHASKYSSSYGYGYSPLISIYDMAQVLIMMETYARKFYEEERTPRSALFIPTNNPNAVQSAWKEAEDINVSAGGTHVPKFTYDPGQTAGNRPVQYLEFSKLPQELQMLETSDYFYRRIGSAFGVAPVFHGNVDAVGLQQQGPTQWQVTVLAAQVGQSVYNDKVLPSLMQQLGVHDWKLKLVEVEEKDEAQKMQLEMMRTQHAQAMQALGYAPKFRDLEGRFVFPNTPAPMGMPGMPGMGPGGGQAGAGGPPGQPPTGGPGGRPQDASGVGRQQERGANVGGMPEVPAPKGMKNGISPEAKDTGNDDLDI